MTEYELADVIASYSMAAMTAMTLYLTAVTGYLVVAFSAGDRLSTSQVFIVSALFVFVSCFFLYGTAGYFYRALDYVQDLKLLDPDRRMTLNIETISFIAVLELLGIFAALYFMWNVRHPKSE